MTETDLFAGAPIRIHAGAVLAVLAGEMSLLEFCRWFEWADDEETMSNPFRDRMRDGFELAGLDLRQDDDGSPIVEFRFKRAE